ncbi:hypothetical protein HY642_07010 [Candidatus Woesearchaeota archaeon]|nr:hypothetical protein [Candidatus Woesearchaeota archaeon]
MKNRTIDDHRKDSRDKVRKAHCDYHGTCKKPAYCEVYPSLLGGRRKDAGWSYLCRSHYEQEQKSFKGRLPYCRVR